MTDQPAFEEASTDPESTSQRDSAESHILDPDRLADVTQKQNAVAELLRRSGLDAILIEQPENFSWFTSGADSTNGVGNEPVASLFITSDARVVLCSNVDSGMLFERELPRLGFQLKERQWTEPRSILVADLCRGRKVGSDTGMGETRDMSEAIRMLRVPLTALECERMRQLGRNVAHAIEATARNCWQGQTESQIAGQLSHRLIKHQITPSRLSVCADVRGDRYRNWKHGDAPVQQTAVISAVGRKWGLNVAASRIVSFGEAPREFVNAHRRAILVQATGMFFSQAEWKMEETWSRLQRIYEKFGFPDEWRKSPQGDLIGYSTGERSFVPNSQFQLTPRMAVHWRPSIGSVLLSDTILVTEAGFELLTPTESWPMLKTEIKGTRVMRPGILVRDVAGSGSLLNYDNAAAADDSVLMQSLHFDDAASKPVTAEEDDREFDLRMDSDLDTGTPSGSDSIFDYETGDDADGDGQSIFD